MKMLESGAEKTGENIAGKPVVYQDWNIISMESAFREKLLSDGPTFSAGTACVYTCAYCYVPSTFAIAGNVNAIKRATGLKHQDMVVRRSNPVEKVVAQLTGKDGLPKYKSDRDRRVIFASPSVDVAATMELARETAEICTKILELTNWQIRLLSKSNLLPVVAEKIPKEFKSRVIYGVSTGTLDDRLAASFEVGTASVSKRIESLRELQEQGHRTFGMICPSLPQRDYARFSREIAQAIRFERCEDVWAEVLNVRGSSMERTVGAMQEAGFTWEAEELRRVSSDHVAWDEYAAQTFEAHAAVFGKRLHFLQYADDRTKESWMERESRGVILLGKSANAESVVASVPPSSDLTKEDKRLLASLEKQVDDGVRASMIAAKALYQIWSYEGGKLWKASYEKFEDYTAAKWGYARSHAFRLRECGSFVHQLEESKSPDGDSAIPLPVHESQVRPILKLPEEERVRCWTRVAKGHAPETLTAQVVLEGATEYAETKGIPLGKKKAPAPLKQRVAKAVDRVEALVARMPREDKRRIQALLQEIQALLE